MTTDMTSGRPTSWDVARLAGVSRSTVSQVLNGNDERFPQETRDRVLAAVSQLSYRPSRAGRSLVTGLSDLIVVVVPRVIFGRHLQDAVESLSARAAPLSMSVVLRYADVDSAVTVAAILDLRPAHVVDFGVFTDQDRHAIETAGIRVQSTQEMIARLAGDPNRQIGVTQARHLLANGERRLVSALLLDDHEDVWGPTRQLGTADEARRQGVAAPLVVRVPLDLAGAVGALRTAVSQAAGQPLGVCCYNDDVAIAIIAAARELNLAVPADIAVIGVDYTQVGQLIRPRLTTVEIDLPKIMVGIADFITDGAAPVVPHLDTIARVILGETTVPAADGPRRA